MSGLAGRAHDLANERLRLARAPAAVPDMAGSDAELVIAASQHAGRGYRMHEIQRSGH